MVERAEDINNESSGKTRANGHGEKDGVDGELSESLEIFHAHGRRVVLSVRDEDHNGLFRSRTGQFDKIMQFLEGWVYVRVSTHDGDLGNVGATLGAVRKDNKVVLDS